MFLLRVSFLYRHLQDTKPMRNPLNSEIRLSSWQWQDPAPDERLDILQRMEKLNDGSACFVERDANYPLSHLHLRKRTWTDWLRECAAEFKAEFGFVRELEELKSARVEAMNRLASALGVTLHERLKQRIREAARGTSFRLVDISRFIAPETLDLSNKSFLISGFEEFNERHRLRRKHELDRLTEDAKEPLRVDQVCDAQGNVHVYVRHRSMKEAFHEFWMSRSAREKIENAARDAIAAALQPVLNESLEAEALPVQHSAVQRSSEGQIKHIVSSRVVRLWIKHLEDAVLVSRPKRIDLQRVITDPRAAFDQKVELTEVNGLRKPRPGFDISEFSPLSFRCDVLVIGSELPKFHGKEQGLAARMTRKAVEEAKRNKAGWELPGPPVHESAEENASSPHAWVDLTSTAQLPHVRNLWCIPDSCHERQQKNSVDKPMHAMPAKEWQRFYSGFFDKAKEVFPNGSLVFELYPSYWSDEGNGDVAPVFTRESIDGAWMAIQHATRSGDRKLAHIHLAIPDPLIREAVKNRFSQLDASTQDGHIALPLAMPRTGGRDFRHLPRWSALKDSEVQ